MCEWQVNKIIREQRMTNSEEVLGIFYELFEFFHAKTTRVELQEYMLSGVLTATQKTTPLQKKWRKGKCQGLFWAEIEWNSFLDVIFANPTIQRRTIT